MGRTYCENCYVYPYIHYFHSHLYNCRYWLASNLVYMCTTCTAAHSNSNRIRAQLSPLVRLRGPNAASSSHSDTHTHGRRAISSRPEIGRPVTRELTEHSLGPTSADRREPARGAISRRIALVVHNWSTTALVSIASEQQRGGEWRWCRARQQITREFLLLAIKQS